MLAAGLRGTDFWAIAYIMATLTAPDTTGTGTNMGIFFAAFSNLAPRAETPGPFWKILE